MSEQKKREQEALNRALSGLEGDPFLARRVIAQSKGETNVSINRKYTRGLILALILTLAMLGTAYAAFSSQVAEFFGLHWGNGYGEWLQNGKVAQVGESWSIGGVQLTLDEVVYKNKGIYAVGTAKAENSRDVLLPVDMADGLMAEPDFCAEQPETKEIFRLADSQGGSMLNLDVTLSRIGVDGGEMLTPGCSGYYNVRNDDGTLTFSFEAEDGFALEDGVRYVLEMKITVEEMDKEGKVNQDNIQRGVWTVACEPKQLSQPSPSTDSAQIISVPDGDWEVVAPEEYRENGTLPVYKAYAADFTKNTDPAWFNQSGVAQRDGSVITFQDHAQLYIDPEGLHYMEYTGELFDYSTAERKENPAAEPMLLPKKSMSQLIASIASWAQHGFRGFDGTYSLEKTELSSITLLSAQAKAEELMTRLGIREVYECSSALDMSLERIRTLGKAYNDAIHRGLLFTNAPEYDYDTATAEDEGYLLNYDLLGVTDANQGRFHATVFVSARGIVYASIRNDFIRGEELFTPDHLITPQDAVQRLAEEISRSRSGEKAEKILKVALTYAPVRAENKTDGMIFAPMWQITYQDAEAIKQNYLCRAEFNAINGELIDAMFR